jgi:hypothetical protein
MTDDIEALLEKGLLQPPPQFATRVMQDLGPRQPSSRLMRRREWLEWLAMAGAALLGFTQLAGFLFGLWIPASAG